MLVVVYNIQSKFIRKGINKDKINTNKKKYNKNKQVKKILRTIRKKKRKTKLIQTGIKVNSIKY